MTSFLNGVTYTTGAASRSDEQDRLASTRRLGYSLVRRWTDRHGHTEPCWHRNCRRDTAHAALLLDALGLADAEDAKPADYGTPLEWGSMSRHEANMLRGNAA
jgi:hypothetical protein